jgi:hypothetical protein
VRLVATSAGILVAVSKPSRLALRRTLIRRLARNSAFVGGLILVALGAGAAGYHVFAGLPWLDASLNAAMILTGMGPVSPVSTPAAKVFAIAYALFSGVFFLTMVAVLLAPGVQHLLHRFHLDLDEQDTDRAAPPRPLRGDAHRGPDR